MEVKVVVERGKRRKRRGKGMGLVAKSQSIVVGRRFGHNIEQAVGAIIKTTDHCYIKFSWWER